jgi:hypothetical protein
MRIPWGAEVKPDDRVELEIVELPDWPEDRPESAAAHHEDGPLEAPIMRPGHDPLGSAGIWEAIANL